MTVLILNDEYHDTNCIITLLHHYTPILFLNQYYNHFYLSENLMKLIHFIGQIIWHKYYSTTPYDYGK